MQLSTELSLDSIREEAGTRTNFVRGTDYYRRHRVGKVKLWRLSDREDIEADVNGSGVSEYTTNASILNDGEIADYECTCPAYEKYGHACKHIVALLLYRYQNKDTNFYRLMSGESPYEDSTMIAKNTIEQPISKYGLPRDTGKTASINTDYRIKFLIEHCVVDDVIRTSVSGDVKAVAKLEFYRGIAFLNITVGKTRQYIVKNMESFCNDIKTCNKTAYGKELELVHHIESFEAESRPLIHFILRKQDEKNRYIRANAGSSYGSYSYSGSGYGPEKEKKNLKLMPSALDELFELLLGTSVSVSCFSPYTVAGTSCREVRLSDQPPELYLEIKELENKKGFVLKLPDCEYVLGEKYVYLYYDERSDYGRETGLTNTLCRCSKEISEKIRALAEAQLETRQPLLVSNADMPSFCSNILAELKAVIGIRGDLERARQFAPDEMQANIYLDSPQDDAITAVLKYQYGEVEIDPNEESAPLLINIARDEKKERIVFFAMNKYFKAYDPNRKFLFIQGDDDILYGFLTEGLEEISKQGQIFASDRFKSMGVRRPAQISVGVRLESDLLNIDLNTGELPLGEAIDALNQYRQKRKYYRMKDGGFLKLDDAGFSELADMVEGLGLSQKDLSQGQITAPKYRALYLDGLLKNSDHVTFERNGHFKSLIRNMKAIDDSDFALTGTPVENRLSELWSIFDFLMPSYLYSYKKFKDLYKTDIVKNGDKKKSEKLSRQISPFMLRRLKAAVLKELPEKVESIVYAKMEGEQKKLYLANLARARSEVDQKIRENSFESNKIAILALLTRLRQICCHPALCYEDYKEESAKLEVCMELLLEATSSGHKVLLFS